ncbi:MAG: hypothetical protein ACREDZ_03595 [Kiloniellales bacterium]
MTIHRRSIVAIETVFACWALTIRPASAEVMDKEPTLTELWGLCAAFSLVSWALSRWRGWAALLVWPLSTLFAYALLSELLNPIIWSSVVAEAGPPYVLQAFGVAALLVAGPPTFMYFGRRKRTAT